MTQKQGTVSLSVGICIAIIAVVGAFLFSSGRSYTQNFTKDYVKGAIKEYDSTVTRRNNAQYDTIINGLKSIKKQLKDSPHE
jgi:hypothetical protein